MRWLLLAIALLAACDRVFGIEVRPDAPEAADAPPDAQIYRVTGTLTRRSITNDADGKPTPPIDMPLGGGVSAIVQFDDQTQARIEIGDDGTFAFERAAADTPYQLLLSLEGRSIEIRHSAPVLALSLRQLGRPNSDRKPVTQPTTIVLPYFGGGTLATTGLWTSTVASTVGVVGLYDYQDWRQSASQSGRRGLLSAAQHDVLYYLAYAKPSGVYSEITSYLERTNLEMTDGATYDLRSPPPVAAVRNACSRLTAPERGAEQQRFVAAVPTFPAHANDWQVYAVPEPALGPIGQLSLASQTALPPALDVTARFANPIRGSKQLASLGYIAARTLTYPGAIGLPLGAGLRSYYPIGMSLDCAANAQELRPTPLGIPGVAQLDGVALANDAVVVPVDRTRDLPLTWPLASAGPVERYDVLLFEVLEDPVSGGTTLRVIRELQSVEPAVSIDGSLLVAGGYYMFAVIGTFGFPGAATGDMSTIAYPYSNVVTYSGMFQAL